MIACNIFPESQIVRMLSNLPSLEVIDCTCSTKVTYWSAFTIVSSLRLLRYINVEPKYPETNDWRRLVHTFQKVEFGHSVMSILSHRGLYLRRIRDVED